MAFDGDGGPSMYTDSLFSDLSAYSLRDAGDIWHGDMSFGRCGPFCSGVGQDLFVAWDVPCTFLVS